MQLVYPPANHKTFEASTFLLGAVPKGETLQINGSPVVVSSSLGFFAIPVTLEPGENHFQLETPSSQQTITIIRNSSPPISRLQETPVLFSQFCSPQQDLGLKAGEDLLLFCAAPAESQVSCQIDELFEEPVPLLPCDTLPDTREGLFAQLHQVTPPWPEGAQLFTAQITLPASAASLPTLAVVYSISHKGDTVECYAPGALTILPSDPLNALIKTHQAICRTTPDRGARLNPLLSQTHVRLSGFSGDSMRVSLNSQQQCWVAREDLILMEEAPYPEHVPLETIHAKTLANQIHLSIPLCRLVPIQFNLQPQKMVITFYNTVSHCNFIQYHGSVQTLGLNQITWHQITSDTLQIQIHLDSPLTGFSHAFDTHTKQWTACMKTSQSQHNHPQRVVLDPGHGGDEPGTLAPNGTPEKDLNLQLALALQKSISNLPDTQVFLTRDTDETVSLQERVERAEAFQGDLLLSLHHNALPDGRNPLQERGVATFYYHPFALPMAKHFQSYLSQQTNFEDYGILYDSLHMCRIHSMPGLLLELGFLTHPEDAALCLDKQHQDKVVHALTEAIGHYPF